MCSCESPSLVPNVKLTCFAKTCGRPISWRRADANFNKLWNIINSMSCRNLCSVDFTPMTISLGLRLSPSSVKWVWTVSTFSTNVRSSNVCNGHGCLVSCGRWSLVSRLLFVPVFVILKVDMANSTPPNLDAFMHVYLSGMRLACSYEHTPKWHTLCWGWQCVLNTNNILDSTMTQPTWW
jgi:hypothetical protein